VNAVDEDGLSPLHMAAQYGHAATISLLIGIGGLLNLQNKVGRTVLIAAVQYGHAGTAKLLLDRKADINLADFKVSFSAHASRDAFTKGFRFAFDASCRDALHCALPPSTATPAPSTFSSTTYSPRLPNCSRHPPHIRATGRQR